MKSLVKERLELAQSPDFPEGSTWHGYEFVAPLKSDGHIDASKWNELKDKCCVVRFWGDAPADEGSLRQGAAVGASTMRRPTMPTTRHSSVRAQALAPGAYVSITEHDGVQRPFRVMMVPWG